MEVRDAPLQGLKIVQLDVHGDERGFFIERFNLRAFAEHGLPCHYVQDNHSRSAPGVVRGLHFQFNPGQGKLIGVARGRIWDVVVDIRTQSPTYGSHLSIELSDLNGQLLWIPAGFAHGFCVLGQESADVIYKVDTFYDPTRESGILWNDPQLAIPWPVRAPTVSGRDQKLPRFADFNSPF